MKRAFLEYGLVERLLCGSALEGWSEETARVSGLTEQGGLGTNILEI